MANTVRLRAGRGPGSWSDCDRRDRSYVGQRCWWSGSRSIDDLGPGAELAFVDLGIGLLGVSLAFGLTVLTIALATGHISGCHLDPAVSVGLWVGGRFPACELLPYIVAQVPGGIVAGGVLYVIASGKAGFDVSAGFASNGYGAHSPGAYSLLAAFVTEVVMTMLPYSSAIGPSHNSGCSGWHRFSAACSVPWSIASSAGRRISLANFDTALARGSREAAARSIQPIRHRRSAAHARSDHLA